MNIKTNNSQGSMKWLLVIAIFGLVGALFLALPIHPAYAAPTVQFQAVTPFAVVDSNTCASVGPQAMYIQVVITNTGVSPISNATATFNGFSNGLFSLAGGQAPSIYIGNLAAGAATNVYWYVDYPAPSPCTTVISTTYTVSLTDVTGTTTSNTGNTNSVPRGDPDIIQPDCAANTMCLDTRHEIGASAGGDVNTFVLGPGIFLGQIVTFTVQYSFGNGWASGADAMVQPAGNIDFNAGCFQLISNTVDSFTNFTQGIVAGATNKLYWSDVDSTGSSATMNVTYSFRVLCAGAGTTAIDPYADLTSGSAGNKYTGNYGTGPTFNPPTNPLKMTKSVSSPSVTAGGSLVYTVTVVNTSTVPILLDIITDTLPFGQGGAAGTIVTYTGTSNAGFVKLINSSFVPAPPITNTGPNAPLHWLSMPNSTWVIPASGSINVVYTVTWPSDAPKGTYQNCARAQVGTVALGPACVNVAIGSPTFVVLSAFGAKVAAAGVTLSWLSGSEINSAGYNIYRAESKQGPYTRINAQLIAATNSVTGNLYEYEDVGALPGKTYYYQIEDIELNGRSTRHDPIAINAPAVDAMKLNAPMAIGIGLAAFAAIAGGLFVAFKKLDVF